MIEQGQYEALLRERQSFEPWTADEALFAIERSADPLMHVGYVAALYGSILTRDIGQDLDLIAVPKVKVPGVEPLHVALVLYKTLLGREWKVRGARNGHLHGFIFAMGAMADARFPRRLVDLTVVEAIL